MALRMVFLGPPGAGKGTQADQIIKLAKIPHISTGDMMRAAVASRSEIGLKAKTFMDSGKLVPDDVIIGVVEDRLRQPDSKLGFLLDGFPRTLPQAEALDRLLAKMVTPLTHVIELVVPEDILVERILKRAQSGSGRSDDTEEVIRKRFNVYQDQTTPLSKYYAAKKLLTTIDGTASVEEVSKSIRNALSL